MNKMYTVVQSLYAYVYALDWVYVETIQLLKIRATTTNKNYHNTTQTYCKFISDNYDTNTISYNLIKYNI